MERNTKRMIQAVLLIALILAAVRIFVIFRSRTATDFGKQEETKNAPLNADYYVTPRKLYAHDLKSARELTRQPAWVREGYKYTYYPYKGRTDFRDAEGLLGPIEKLNITDVVVEKSPEARNRQLMAVFEKEGKQYSFPIGLVEGNGYQIYIDEILYVQDPRELYKHWPAEVWQAIEAHQVRPGMNEIQVTFAVGAGALESGSRTDERVIRYENGGNPLTVTFRDGKAADIRQESARAG